MCRRTFFLALLVIACSCLVFSAPPNFSGKWVLDKDQSDFRTRGGEKPDITMTVVQTADALSVKQESSVEFMNREYTLKLNGEAQEVPGRGGRMSKMRPVLEGDVLVLTRVRESDQGQMTSTERWQLSADGTVLTIAGKNQTPRGEFESKMIYQKQ